MNQKFLCRVCTGKDHTAGLVDIFEKQNGQDTIAEMLLELAGIKAHVDDGLPRLCCNECRANLASAVAVRRKCIASDELLHASVAGSVSDDNQSDHRANDQCINSDEDDSNSVFEDAIYNCNECLIDFYDAVSLRDHYESKHANAIYGWKSFGVDEISLFDATDEENEITPIAPDVIPDVHATIEPILSHPCCGCSKVFDTDIELRTHSETVHAPDARETNEYKCFRCDICYRVFTTPKGVLEHRSTKRWLRFLCAACGLAYGTHQQLLRHEFSHGKETFACDICDQCCPDPFALKQHKRKKHTGNVVCVPQEHVCKICHRNYSSATNLKQHIELHSDELKYVCALCGERFKVNRYLQGHMAQLHTGRYRCTRCNTSFKNVTLLKRHMSTHAESRQFSCGVCGSSFYNTYDLKYHEHKVHNKAGRIKRVTRKKPPKGINQVPDGSKELTVCERKSERTRRLNSRYDPYLLMRPEMQF